MKRMFVVSVVFFLTLFCIAIQDVSSQGLKIGVFDLQKVMKESKTIEGYRQDVVKQIEAKRKPLKDREESAKATEEKLKKEGEKLSANERRVLEERLASDVKDIRRLREDVETEVRKIDAQQTQKALGIIGVAVKDIAEKEGYTVIFERGAAGVVYFKDTIDITNKIIQQMK